MFVLNFQMCIRDRECGDVGEKTADYFYPISIIEKEQILDVDVYKRQLLCSIM